MRAPLVLVAVAASVTLTGCGSGPQGGPSALPATPSASATGTESAALPSASATNDVGVEINARGNIPKALGEEAGIGHPTNPSAPWVLTFAVDAIIPDVQCSSGFSSAPVNGHFIGIQVRAATTADFRPDQHFITFSARDFRVVGPDGLTVSDVQGMAGLCLGPNGFTEAPLGPGQQYAGTVVIDSPVTSGSLIYAPMGQPNGWEWQF